MGNNVEKKDGAARGEFSPSFPGFFFFGEATERI